MSNKQPEDGGCGTYLVFILLFVLAAWIMHLFGVGLDESSPNNDVLEYDRAYATEAYIVHELDREFSDPSSVDCDDFNTQRAAQNYYNRNYGRVRDLYELDGDKDGVACESLP